MLRERAPLTLPVWTRLASPILMVPSSLSVVVVWRNVVAGKCYWKLAYDDDGNLRNMCDKCSRSFCTTRLLKKHCNESHSVSCATCDETFTTKMALDSHIQTCEQCKEIFCNKRAFSIHIGNAHILEYSFQNVNTSYDYVIVLSFYL